MATIAIVQARMGSTRFPNKVVERIIGIPMIECLLRRLSNAKRIDEVVVATTVDARDEPLCRLMKEIGIRTFQGNETDVLDRYYQAALYFSADVIVRITGDCPLVDPAIVDTIVDRLVLGNFEYCSNVDPPTFPDGLDVEVMTIAALRRAWEEATVPLHREHVTMYIRESKRFRTGNVENAQNLSKDRWTVDEPSDLEVVRAIYEHFSPKLDFSWQEVLELKSAQPELFRANTGLTRNEGDVIGNGQKLWKRAKRVIPGGNMLLSKRAEMFLPERWPAYFSRAKGCQVWDLDGRQYTDMSIMGIGTNILGYGHPEVDEAVISTVQAGNMSTLNCPEEVHLVERLVQMHPWAEMGRLARSGGEANAIAIRIARAASGRDKVAICGYHGWHDWYLSANLGDDENLAGHLLPGLNPKGVPQHLRGTVFPFNYNDLSELTEIVSRHDIGVIKMEVSRNKGPDAGFLEAVRQLANDKQIVLVFDECTSGFRETFGGLHKKYGVEPDMAMFGKALGNGYAITAVIGRRSVMEAAQETFISSTFWTERIGPTAALKTLQVMERERSWETITQTGKRIAERWLKLANEYDVPLSIAGLPALIGFSINHPDALKYKTLITQEMLKEGYLASTAVYVSTEHTPPVVDDYFTTITPVFATISRCIRGKVDINDLLESPVCHAGFRRLN